MARRRPRWAELKELVQFDIASPLGNASRLRRAQTIGDLRDVARRRTPRAVFDYTDGGADDEVSVARNRAAFRRVEFSPRVLRDVGAVDLHSSIFGHVAALPVVLGPTGFTRLMHHEGEGAVARAAGNAGVPYTLSTMGTTSISELATAAPDCRKWFQLYLWRDRAASTELVNSAQEFGFDTLILTVDVPVPGRRLRDVRNGMTIPPSLRASTVIDGARHPAWWINFLTTEPLEFAALKRWNGTVAELTARMFDPSATLAQLEWLRESWSGNLVVKGVQSVQDARLLVEAGADGIVVSNHGGRQLDRSPTPLEILPSVVEAVGSRAKVFVDGGVMSGADVIAAVALGADAAWIGRAYLYGLMAGGEAGVNRALEIIRDEAASTMRLLGAQSLGDLTSETVRIRFD